MNVKLLWIFCWAFLLVLEMSSLALAGYKPPKDQKPPKETGSTAQLLDVAPELGSIATLAA